MISINGGGVGGMLDKGVTLVGVYEEVRSIHKITVPDFWSFSTYMSGLQ